jgi:hypothetical protein
VFDPEETGRVVPNELLMAFSMSMKGTGNEGLKSKKLLSKIIVVGYKGLKPIGNKGLKP